MNRFKSVSAFRDKFIANSAIIKAPAKMPITATKKSKPRGAIKQYGDSGYTPSTGSGTGY